MKDPNEKEKKERMDEIEKLLEIAKEPVFQGFGKGLGLLLNEAIVGYNNGLYLSVRLTAASLIERMIRQLYGEFEKNKRYKKELSYHDFLFSYGSRYFNKAELSALHEIRKGKNDLSHNNFYYILIGEKVEDMYKKNALITLQAFIFFYENHFSEIIKNSGFIKVVRI